MKNKGFQYHKTKKISSLNAIVELEFLYHLVVPIDLVCPYVQFLALILNAKIDGDSKALIVSGLFAYLWIALIFLDQVSKQSVLSDISQGLFISNAKIDKGFQGSRYFGPICLSMDFSIFIEFFKYPIFKSIVKNLVINFSSIWRYDPIAEVK